VTGRSTQISDPGPPHPRPQCTATKVKKQNLSAQWFVNGACPPKFLDDAEVRGITGKKGTKPGKKEETIP